jgi:hypothetical protein
MGDVADVLEVRAASILMVEAYILAVRLVLYHCIMIYRINKRMNE